MRNLLLLFALLVTTSSHAQVVVPEPLPTIRTDSQLLTVETTQAKYLAATSAILIPQEDGSVRILAEDVQTEKIDVILIRVTNVNDISARAFLISNSLIDAFPPRKVPEIVINGQKVYSLEGKPGDIFALEVELENGLSQWETIKFEGSSTEPDKPPVTNPGNWEQLVKVVKELTPDEPPVKAVLINVYKAALLVVNDASYNVDSARAFVAKARADAFMQQLVTVNKDWSILLYAISDQVKVIEDKAQYIEAMSVVISTLEKL